MEVFGPQWANHVQRLEEAWNEMVTADDTVIVAGDIDWALHPEDAMNTLDRLARWPGLKVLIRGNHDYWWSSKTTNKVRKMLPQMVIVIHNDALQIEGFNICGTKGSPVPGSVEWTTDHEKLLNREQHRLRFSLEARDPRLPTLVAMHYPPFYLPSRSDAFTHLLEESGVVSCVYGHLHGDAARLGPSGRYGDIAYRLVAGDAVDFRPAPIARDGMLLLRPAPSREEQGMGAGSVSDPA
jgi:predicted phosphohydrolase